MRFEVVATCGAARAGILSTPRGCIHTPAFMPVGTLASVKGLDTRELDAAGVECVVANAYHLSLRPGVDVIAQAGGLHAFMGWDRPILTDSGGFQVLSLARLRHIDEQGVTFQDARGEKRKLTPEAAMEIQAVLAPDIAVVLDVCLPYPCGALETEEAAERTIRWARRSLQARGRFGQPVFGIVQGGVDPVLRRRSAQALASLPFDGYGIGGLSVGETRNVTWPAVEGAVGPLPPDRPRHLMGVGAPDDVTAAIAHGIDLFDCVLPTRLGRSGIALTASGRLDVRSSTLARSVHALDPACICPACSHFSLGYLHHLVRCREDLALRLLSLHNVRFLARLAADARQAIVEGRFDAGRGD